MQLLTIAGNVGKDAVLRTTGNGDKVLGFSLGVSNGKDKNGEDRPTTWFDASLWGKRAESLERHIKKGTKLVLSGRPSAREHEGKAYLGISVDQLTFMGGGQRSEGSAQDHGSSLGGKHDHSAPDLDFDEVPF